MPKGFSGLVLAGLAAIAVLIAAGAWLGTQMRALPEPHNRPDFSPDGEWVVYERDAGAAGPAIWIGRPDDTAARLLVEAGRMPSWSPDGESILYTADQRLWTVPAGGGEPHLLEPPGPPERPTPAGAQWSRRPGVIEYAQYGREGWRVWRLEVETGRREAIGPVGAMRVVESFDGGALFYTLDRENGLALILEERDSGERRIVGESVLDPSAFAVSQQAVYWVEPGPDPYGEGCLWRWDLETKQRRKVGAVVERPRLSVAVSPNDRVVVASRISGSGPRFQIFRID